MKSKLLPILVAGLFALTAIMSSCNSESEDEIAEVVYSSTQVKSFKLKANANILSSLDTVFFSIDLAKAQIYNADSLPYGTKVDKLVVQIATDACSVVELNVPRKNQADTVINYLTNSTDSIDFSNGPVKLHLVSFDGSAKRDYMVRVNVHKMEPDSLYWNEMAKRELPTELSVPTFQKSVKYQGNVVCLTSDGTDYNVAYTENPYNDDWEVEGVTFGFTPEVSTLTATEDALYILSTAGTLYSSTDGKQWSSTGQQWHHIYGGYEEKLLGVKEGDTGYLLVTYPTSSEVVASAEMPIESTSQVAELTSKWSTQLQTIMLGGRKASGEYSRAVWGYDGKQWAKISEKFPKEVGNASMFNYRVAEVDTLTWQVTELPVLIAMGGENASGLNKKVYVSRNSGIDWKEGDEFLQLPRYILPRTQAQAIVVDQPVTVSRTTIGSWKEYQSTPLPGWWKVARATWYESRAVAPITEWDVPYIYLFGGYDQSGVLYDSVWRGVINRLVFKPLQ